MSDILRPVVFLDRDGVINVDRDDYVKNLNELIVFPFAPESIARLNDAGYAVVVVSNQQCVAKGLMSLEQLKEIENEIKRQVASAGGCIMDFYYCTHFKSDNCDCRKPKPGMLTQAIAEHNLDSKIGFIVGDNDKDIYAGRAVGSRGVLVMSGMANEETPKTMTSPPDYVANDLQNAVNWILSQTSK